MKKMFGFRRKAMVWTDKRARLIGELLGGMRVLKFFGASRLSPHCPHPGAPLTPAVHQPGRSRTLRSCRTSAQRSSSRSGRSWSYAPERPASPCRASSRTPFPLALSILTLKRAVCQLSPRCSPLSLTPTPAIPRRRRASLPRWRSSSCAWARCLPFRFALADLASRLAAFECPCVHHSRPDLRWPLL